MNAPASLAVAVALLLVLFALAVARAARASRDTSELLRLRDELTRVRDAALAASRAKTEFLATMSHELRTPLNAVIGMATLLADTELTPDQRERLDVIRSSGEALLTLIGDILDVTKIEAGKLEVESAPVDVARVVEEALDQVAAAAAAKGIEIGYAMADGAPAFVLSDATRVRQILVNLLGNAVKFTSSGSVVVRVEGATRDDGRAEIAFAVRDTGIGIDRETLGRLFVPFTQADAGTARRFGGSGLGLAICRSLAELLGGRIGAESAAGEGSTFRFTIVGKALAQARPRALPINAGEGVCVVGEDALARELLVAHATGLGFAAEGVATADEARASIAAGRAAVVVLDPRGSPEGAASAARALREAGAPVVVLVPRRAATPPNDDPLLAFVSKPVKVARLLEVIEALLAGRPARERASSAEILFVPPRDAAGGSVLVVDDDDVNRRVAVEMVRRLGLTARAVGGGAQAVEAVRAERFDHVLMDVQMPDMDGFEATRRILAAAGPRRPRIVAMTANALPGDRERCLAAGMSDYVTKPVRPAALAAALRRPYEAPADHVEPSSITAVLDPQVLEDLMTLEATSGVALLAELAESFRTDAPARVEELRAASRIGDLVTVKSLAHRLRGSAGAIGANRVFVTATEVESRAGTMPAPELDALVGRLSSDVDRANDAFARVLARRSAKAEGEP